MNEDLQNVFARAAEEEVPKRKRKSYPQSYDELKDAQKKYRDRLKEEGYKRLSVQMSGQEYMLLKNAAALSGQSMREYLVGRAEADNPATLCPDLYRIEQTARKAAALEAESDDGLPSGFDRMTVRLDTFLQTWPTTSGGLYMPGEPCIDEDTEQYTTVARVTLEKRLRSSEGEGMKKDYHIVFFRNTGAYILTEPNLVFFEDVKNRDVLGKYEALSSDRYFYHSDR